MKKLLIYILNRIGYKLVKKSYYGRLINVNNLSGLDCHYLLKNNYDKDDTLCCFDIGANVGQTEKKLRRYYPTASIYCFEPVKNTYDKLVNNLQAQSSTKTFNTAMGSCIEEKEIYHRKDSEWNTLVTELNDNAQKEGASSEIIKVDTIDNFVREEGIQKIHFLKSDTEGFEMDVLKGAADCLNNQLVDNLYIEVGFNKEDLQHNYWIDIIEFLKKYNYHFSGLFEVSYGSNLRIHYANALFCSNGFVYGKSGSIA